MALEDSDIIRAEENIKAVNAWAEGGQGTVAEMANGRKVPSPLKMITDARLYKAPLPWSAGINVTDAAQSYTRNDVVYAPQPSKVPFTTGPAFDPSNWYVLQGVFDTQIIQEFETVNDMELSVTLVVGQTVIWRGYYAESDGGENWGIVVPLGSGVDDGGQYFTIDNGVQVKAFKPTSVKQFGANPSQADNVDALKTAMESGLPLDFGDYNDTYTITSELAVTITANTEWKSSGATIQVNSVSSIYSAVRINIDPVDLVINGVLQIDANDNAYAGLMIRNTATPIVNFPSGAPNVTLIDVQTYNIYRTGITYPIGDGFSIVGAFNRLILKRPVAIECKMAVGADIFQVQGISGITIADDNSGNYPFSTVLEDCYIENVYSEDPTVNYDQDGIKLFTDRGIGPEHTRSSFHVRGGEVRNSRNRSLKAQSQTININQFKIVKDSSIDLGANGITQNPDVDLQTGGGIVAGLEYYYDNFVGTNLFRYDEDSNTRTVMPSLQLSGMVAKFTAATTQTPESAIKIFSDDSRNQMNVNISNVEILGSCENFLNARCNGPNVSKANITNVSCDATIAFVEVISSGDFNGHVTNAIHSGASPVQCFNAASGGQNQILSVVNGSNFTDEPDIKAGGPYAPSTRVHSIAPFAGADCGTMRIVSKELVNQEIFELPIHGYNSGSTSIWIHVARSGAASLDSIVIGAASGSSGSVAPLFLGGYSSRFNLVNGTTEPPGATEDYIVWGNNVTTGGGPFFKNNSGNPRLVTFVMMG